MGVYIKGMEMPKSCYKCYLKQRNGINIVCPVAHERFSVADVNILEYRLDNCPLVPVPPHGRLIDGDKLDEYLKIAATMTDGEAKEAYIDARAEARTMPVIIPAEEGET